MLRKASTLAEARLHRASVSFNAILMHVLGGFKAHGGDGDSGLYNTKKGLGAWCVPWSSCCGAADALEF